MPVIWSIFSEWGIQSFGSDCANGGATSGQNWRCIGFSDCRLNIEIKVLDTPMCQYKLQKSYDGGILSKVGLPRT